MMRLAVMGYRLSVAAALLAAAPLGAAPRIIFERTVPAMHDLGPAEHLTVLYAIGDNEVVSTFVDVLVEHTNRSGPLRVDDATEHGHHHAIGEHPDDAERRRIRREHPADLYLGVNRFTCQWQPRSAEGSTRDSSGERVKRLQVWIDAVCRTRVDVIDGEAAKRLFSFQVKGEGTSPRVADLTHDERDIALEQAARYAAIEASEEIMPRRVRESIELDETAPDLDEGMSLIEANRLRDARARWEVSLKHNPASAALRYNLAAVCEASGDLTAARDYFQQALRLSPSEARYRVELDLFRKRNLPRQ